MKNISFIKLKAYAPVKSNLIWKTGGCTMYSFTAAVKEMSRGSPDWPMDGLQRN